MEIKNNFAIAKWVLIVEFSWVHRAERDNPNILLKRQKLCFCKRKWK